MLTDYYALLQPTKVNTGASFNLLQSRSFPRWARLRCTEPRRQRFCFQRGIFPSWSPSCPWKQAALPVRPSGRWHEQRHERRPREGTERKAGNTRCSPLAPRLLPSTLFTLRPSDPQASAQQAPQRSASALLGPSSPGRPGSADGGPPTCFSQLGPRRTRQDSR